MTEDIIEIHVQLLNEGSPTARPALARRLDNGFYQIILSDDYDPEDEDWQFVPGDVVRCEKVEHGWKIPLFLAVEKIL